MGHRIGSIQISWDQDRLLVTLRHGPFGYLCRELVDLLAERQAYLRGNPLVLALGGQIFSLEQLVDLHALVTSRGVTFGGIRSDALPVQRHITALGLAAPEDDGGPRMVVDEPGTTTLAAATG